MHIGIDFDNTLVCYDQLFWTLARERDAIAVSIPPTKEAVREELRRQGREALWTELQGLAYGPRIAEASPFPGVLEALAEFRRRGWRVSIISHKTLTPYVGPAYDLHAATFAWLEQYPLLARDAVFLELERSAKLQRIATCACDWFIDDLPEILSDPAFPSDVQRILFDPHGRAQDQPGQTILRCWSEAADLIDAESAS